MAKNPRPPHAVQQSADTAPPPVEESAPPSPPAPAPEDDIGPPTWGWTIAIVVWVCAFGGLAIYEVWTGMIAKLIWHG